MSISEKAVVFGFAGEQLVGVLARPECSDVAEGLELGVLVVVGGPQYRAGSHRQFLLLSRKVAEAGFPVFRFDYRGMGDSGGERRDFEAVSGDIGAAVEDASIKWLAERSARLAPSANGQLYDQRSSDLG